MYCPHCGKTVGEKDEFCEHCGKSLDETATPGAPQAPAAETLMYSFGPFGVSICDGPYSMFKWQRKNTSTIELTNRRLCMVPSGMTGLFKMPAALPSSRASFQIPYSSITSVEVYAHPAGLGMMDVLDIKFVDGSTAKEKSIASYRDRIAQAAVIIARASGAAAPTSPAS